MCLKLGFLHHWRRKREDFSRCSRKKRRALRLRLCSYLQGQWEREEA